MTRMVVDADTIARRVAERTVTPRARPDDALRLLPISALFVDADYQRPTDEARVMRMAATFDPRLVGVLEVSDREDGTYAVVDGGHRLAMLEQLHGDDPHASVHCHVHTGLSIANEAALFHRIDTGRRQLTGWDRWYARRAAGDLVVVQIEQVVNAHGLRIEPNTRAGSLRCVRSCEALVALEGLELLSDTLRILLTAFGREDANAIDAELVEGVGQFLHAYPGWVDLESLTDTVASSRPQRLKAQARALRETEPGTLPTLVAKVLRRMVNETRPAKSRLPAFHPRRAHQPPRVSGGVPLDGEP